MLKGFLKDILIYLPSRLLPALTAFITIPIVTRLFAPAEYGYMALAVGLSDFLVALASSGFGSAVIRFLPAYSARSALGAFFLVLGVLVAAALAGVGSISAGALLLLRERIPAALFSLFVISLLIFLVQTPFNVFMAVARAQERSRLYTIFQLLFRYGSLGLGLLLVLVFGFGIEGMLWGTFLALAFTLPFLARSTTKGLRFSSKDVRPADATQIWRYAWPLALGNMAMWGLRLSDRYIIGLYRPASEVGLYSAAYGISERSVDIIVGLFLLSVSPLVMNTWESRGGEATEEVLTMVSRVYLIFCLPIAVGVTVMALPFVELLTAPAYHEGYRIVGYVAFGSFAWGLSHIAHMGLAIKKRPRRLGANQIIAALANLGLNVALVPRFGYVVAGVTTLAGYVILVALQAYGSRAHVSWRFPFKTLRNVLIAALCMGFAAWGIYALIDRGGGQNVVGLAMSVAIAAPIYLGCLWVLGEAREKEKAALAHLWHTAIRTPDVPDNGRS